MNEFMAALAREHGVPPLPKYETELRRLLSRKRLLTDDGETVSVSVRGRERPLVRIKKVEDDDDG